MVKKMKLVPILVIVVLVLSLGITLPVTRPISAAVGVLFETGHQREACNMSGYSSMTADLTSRGFNFTEDSDGNITEADLSGNHILVIVEPACPLSASEISNIQNFVAAGHGLLLMSDVMSERGRAAVNTLLSPYDIQQATGLTKKGIYTDITGHATTTGVTQYDQHTDGCKFTIVDSPALSLIRDGEGSTLVAAWHASGRIVVVSDEQAFRQVSYNKLDNNILMRNIFDWLSHIGILAADFSAQPRTGQAPLNVRFTDESTGDIDTWRWDFGDGTTSDEQNPTHIYERAGRYTVSLEVTGARGIDTDVKRSYIHVTELSGRVAEAEPAKFVTSYANIEPTEVLPNQAVRISINVGNCGTATGSYRVVLNINGNFEDSQVISVSPGSSQRVVFDVTKITPGTYEVSINGHKGQFMVIVSTPSGLPIGGGLETPTIIGIILGSAGAAVAIVLVTRRRRRRAPLLDAEERFRKLLDELRRL